MKLHELQEKRATVVGEMRTINAAAEKANARAALRWLRQQPPPNIEEALSTRDQ